MLNELKLRLIGTADLIQHNVQLANPLSEASRRLSAISHRRNKTDSDLAELARAEWEGGMYYDSKIGPYIPCDMIFASLIIGAKKTKRGKDISVGVILTSLNGDAAAVPLKYDGPRTLDGMWGNGNSSFVYTKVVRVQANRIIRTRPIFPAGWTADVQIRFMPQIFNVDDLLATFSDAGLYGGLGERRPMYGRYEVELI